jgi:hypothetical protein
VEYAEVLQEIDNSLTNSAFSGDMDDRISDSLWQYLLYFGQPDQPSYDVHMVKTVMLGTLAWLQVEGYIEFTDKALKQAPEGEEIATDEDMAEVVSIFDHLEPEPTLFDGVQDEGDGPEAG